MDSVKAGGPQTWDSKQEVPSMIHVAGENDMRVEVLGSVPPKGPFRLTSRKPSLLPLHVVSYLLHGPQC